MNNLEELKNSINEEIQLYNALNTLFEEKRKILISNKADDLLKVDDKILNTIDSVKTVVNHRRIVSKLVAGKDLSLTEIIALAKSSQNSFVADFEAAQKQIIELSEELATKERIIKELIHHGINMVDKTLKLISNTTSIAGDYNRTGKNVQSDISRISSVVEDV